MIDLIETFHQILWIALGLALLGLFDELNTPARPGKKRRTGTVHWDESSKQETYHK